MDQVDAQPVRPVIGTTARAVPVSYNLGKALFSPPPKTVYPVSQRTVVEQLLRARALATPKGIQRMHQFYSRH